ncbi:DUF389 domain-containing protein [Desulfovibrio sp. JC022]|uniref:DUF389 domain-containing protein n=1 Tax=Desulfovibrio sp. JC022 TaxID=2593642 RepID=UPI0013D73C08|nr:DUF389 domain-containing protein [Desulfovibrio sp. JC022]NDV22927.1 DUF389 domain-containing protein [Desulfovibrio sp. JC022]
MGLIFRRKNKVKTPLLFVSDVRREFLITEITRNSIPRGMYYLLMGVAVFIASIGLTADSPAVVIGAMLVSPLMTPIFGLSLGLVRGEVDLIRDSILSVAAGIFIGILGGMLIGSLPIFFELTHEIISRTKPNLLDLGVAAFAGIAGTVALIDERVSPVMPGIAIATALVPPLCASGLCIALGQYTDGWGAFLLFFANFLVILSVASALFVITGFIPHSEDEPLPRLIKHFSISTVGLIIVAALLTKSLVEVALSRQIDNSLRTVASQAITSIPNTTIEKISHEINEGTVNGFVTLKGPFSLKANAIQKMEKTAAQTLHKPVKIIVRTSITQSISSSPQSTSELLNAHAKKQHIKLEKSALILEQAELLLRSVMSEYPWYTLSGINYTKLKSGPGLIIEISGPERPMPESVEKLEGMLRKNTEVDNLSLIIRYYKSYDITRNGRNLFGIHYSGTESPQAKKIEKETAKLIGGIRNIFPIHVEAQQIKKSWKIMADVTGARLVQSKEIKKIEKKLAAKFSAPVKLYVYSKTEGIVEGEGIKPLEFFSTTQQIKRLDVK